MKFRKICNVGQLLKCKLITKVRFDVIECFVYSGNVFVLGWILHRNADNAD